MIWTIPIILVLSVLSLVSGSGEGNIHILKEDVSNALQSCSLEINQNNASSKRYRRYEENYNDIPPRIDANSRQEKNQYDHERRNLNFSDQMDVMNGSDFYNLDDTGNKNSKVPQAMNYSYNKTNSSLARHKRNEPLFSNDDADQCLSQCVFANLEVVDARGIPREAELWNKIQESVSSQQSRALLKDQIRSCFQELESESEDNGCSYSNKLERCLMLRFSDRRKQYNNKTSSSQ